MLPELPYRPWEATHRHLHLMLQVVGKIRLARQPRVNHWWHVPFYVTPHGLTNAAMPSGDGLFELAFDLRRHRLVVRTSWADESALPLSEGSVAAFHRRLLAVLAEAGIEPAFQSFRGRFLGKATPVHLFWHSMDLALTRFSGARAPELPHADPVTRDAYSHEVVSFGFWAGDRPSRPSTPTRRRSRPVRPSRRSSPRERAGTTPAAATWRMTRTSACAAQPRPERPC
jgi:hypothetical protein